MESISGVSSWKLTVRREAEHVEILRAVTCEETAVLPDTLFDLPVTVLGDHALSPTAAPMEGEEVLVTCGPLGADPGWDNHRLRDLTMPRHLKQVGDYALLNCDGLETLRLWDDVRRWNGGTLMNCRALHAFHLTRTSPEQGETLAYFNDELSRELDVTIVETDGQIIRLLFPEFMEIYEENCPAHVFDYNICGAGYPYHHCFRQKKLNLKTYDGLWKAYLGMEHEDSAALRLAWYRLRYPVDLGDKPREAYRAYLADHASEVVAWLLEQKDPDGIRFLLDCTQPDRQTLTDACALAREKGAAEALALLLEEQHRRFDGGMRKEFAL